MAVIGEGPCIVAGRTITAADRNRSEAAARDGRGLAGTVGVMAVGTEAMDIIAGRTVYQGGYRAHPEATGGVMAGCRSTATGGQNRNFLRMINVSGVVIMGVNPGQVMTGSAVTA